MDTRTKIIDEARAASIAEGGATVVSGTFDPLLASSAARLAEIRRELKDGTPLLVLISDTPDAILPVRARAELVAGLAVVDYVCETLGALAPDVRLEAEQFRRREQLIAHVHSRHQAASQG